MAWWWAADRCGWECGNSGEGRKAACSLPHQEPELTGGHLGLFPGCLPKGLEFRRRGSLGDLLDGLFSGSIGDVETPIQTLGVKWLEKLGAALLTYCFSWPTKNRTHSIGVGRLLGPPDESIRSSEMYLTFSCRSWGRSEHGG